MKPIFIYMLFDTLNEVPLYIGATMYPASRMYSHKSTTLKMYENKSIVKMIILEEVEEKYAGEREMFWYNKKKDEGYNLLQAGKFWYPEYQKTKIDFRAMIDNDLFKDERDAYFKKQRKLLKESKKMAKVA